jgi:predicted metalloprotease with PDZ domain
MKNTLMLFLLTGFLISCSSVKKVKKNDLATQVPIESSIDLTKVTNDKAPVIINPGRFTIETVTYRLPKIIQGTYQVSDFGNFVDEFKAFDYDGYEMQVEKVSTNTWMINDATKLDKITYLVNDTFDVEYNTEINTPHSMAGTNIEPDNYVLNLHGFIGYFDSLKNNQYKLDITAPKDFVRTSALQVVGTKTSDDGTALTSSYFAPRYFDITDNPMMYGNLTVEEFNVGDIKIVLSVYSPKKLHSASSLKQTIEKMMQAQKAYLGNVNSTPRYDIYVYLGRGDKDSPSKFGALEHHTSTVVVMPEATPEKALAKSMVDIVSHEFFHIVTPLSVHSEDVHYFDYNKPTFSKHLWMYEGVTEYFATLFQVDQKLVPEDEFYAKILSKINSSLRFNDAMSFTVMSENILEKEYAPNYGNVYQKGALIGMCIDILMREASVGNRGILSLMKELSLKYGKNKPFEDDKIIDEIATMTYPSIRNFFDTHVIGSTPIDYNVYFDKVGLEITKSKLKTNYVQNAGTLIFGVNQEKGEVYFNDLVVNNSFWNEQGVKPNDVIRAVNGAEITMQNVNQIFGQIFGWQPGQEVDVKLDRAGEEVVIKTELTQSYTKGNKLTPKEDITEAQSKLRNAWIKG